MPEIGTYTFSHRELLELMIRHAGIHEGEWVLQANFVFTAGNFGPDENDVFPGGLVIVQKLGITRATTDSPKSLVVDAARINPPPGEA